METRKVALLRPAVWKKTANGTYQLQRKGNKMPTGDDLQQGIWSFYGSSQDGTVISVVADHPSGSRSPAVMINGELTRIYGKEDINVNLDDQYFYDGVSVTVSPNGKYVPGYWSPTGTSYDQIGFLYDTETDSLEELEGWGAATVALDDGSIFGFDGYMGAAMYKGNLPQTILSASGDGKTFGGWYSIADAIGALMVPSIVVLNSDPNAEPDHITEWKNDQRTIIVLGDEVIAPMAVKVELYSAQGVLLDSTTEDSITLEGAQGVVIVKESA